jgi:hypothetical protein
VDRVTRYRDLVKKSLAARAALTNRGSSDGSENVCALDEERDQYLLLNVGWSGERRVRGTTLFVRILNGKIWIEEDWTEDGIANELVSAGVPKDDIVLAFHHPSMRRLTDFAVA